MEINALPLNAAPANTLAIELSSGERTPLSALPVSTPTQTAITAAQTAAAADATTKANAAQAAAIAAAATDATTKANAAQAASQPLDSDLTAYANAANQFARLTAVGAARADANPLRRTFAKLEQILDGPGAQLRYLVAGDSLGYRKAKYIAAQLRSALGTAGFIGIAGQNGGMFTFPITAGSPVAAPVGTDYTKTPTGSYTTLASSGQIVGAQLGSAPAAFAAYSPPLVQNVGVLAANQIKILYTREPGAGTVDVQISADLSNWTTVQAGFSAAGTNSFQVANFTVTAQQVRGVRCVWASGSVKIWGVGAVNTSGSGTVVADFSQGGVDMASGNATPGYASVLNDFAPDFLTLEARDNIPGVGLAPALPGYEALFSTLPERIYIGMNQWSIDSTNDWTAYNAAIAAHAAANGALYFPAENYLGDYANTVALGWLTGVGDDHPNDRASFYCANFLLRDSGLLAPITAGRLQRNDALRLGGVLYSRAVAFNSVGSAAGSVETDLMSYTLPANVVTADGDTIVIQAKFATVGGSVSKRIRCYVLGTVVADTTTVTQGGGFEFYVTLNYAANRIAVSRIIQYFNSPSRVDDNQSLALNLALGGIIKFTGVGVSLNDVSQQSMIVELKRAV